MKPSTVYALVAPLVPFALASPYHQRRHAEADVVVVTQSDVVTQYTQDVVTQYADAPQQYATTVVQDTPPTTLATQTSQAPQSFAPEPPTEHKDHHGGDRGGNHGWNNPWSSAWTSAWTSTWTQAAPAPAPTTSSSSSSSTTSTSSTPTTSSSTSSSTPVAAPTVAPTTSSSSQSNGSPTSVAFPPGYTAVGDKSYQDAASMQAAVLNSTNWWRDLFQASPVTWNASVAKDAQDWANQCKWDHFVPKDSNQGQNLGGNYAGPTTSIDSWAGENKNYNGDFTEQCGHFSQVVWQATTSVGCAAKRCPDNAAFEGAATGWFFVCNYYPAGNMAGGYASNVKSPKYPPPNV